MISNGVLQIILFSSPAAIIEVPYNYVIHGNDYYFMKIQCLFPGWGDVNVM